MKKTIRVMLVAVILSACMLFACACGNLDPVTESVVGDTIPDVIPDDDVVNDVVSDAYESSSTLRDTTIPTGEYNKGVVLVKYDGALTSSLLGDLDVKSVEQLFKGSKWHTILLEDGVDTEEAVKYLHKLDVFETVDYDYVMKSDGDTVDISGNTYAEDLTYLDTMGVKNGWEHNANNKKYPGGSADVVIAIIDTGVDYNHIDLRNNIWVNSAEIPGNGIDDDGNGYVDDVNGWNCVGDNNDPMDDNGHGTHVAGIAAAENNKTGTVGVAYNCKIMCLKAGNSSGYFNNSDIAEAIQYAYMNGASVINMSFGGSSISIAVEDALMDAYNQCVLVAAAGNKALCNYSSNPLFSCPVHGRNVGIFYPAALPYVIGVMSCNANGTTRSPFSNFDHYPYGTVEYEVYACGEEIPSTWPGNKYATLSGTSMACPVVAGIAAVLRSTYPDREVYSNKYIQSQIVNTGTKHAFVDESVGIDEYHAVADLHEALTRIPTPNIKLYDYFIDDSTSINEKNNGNGIIDAGETVRLYISLHNRGGVASNVNVSIDTYRGEIGDETLTDPYFAFVNSTMELSDIGTYSVRESGEKYFEIVVSDDCPNDYLVDFNIRSAYENGLDENDEGAYISDGKVSFTVNNGIHLPVVIDEDMILEATRRYIVSHDVTIIENVTVTIEPGVNIVYNTDKNGFYIKNYGTILCNGAENKNINIDFGDNGIIYPYDSGFAEFTYTQFIGSGSVHGDTFDRCIFTGVDAFGSSFSNSKFLSGQPFGGIVKHCQIIDTKNELTIPYEYSNTVFENSVFLLNKPDHTIRYVSRYPLDFDSIESIVQYKDKSYLVIHCVYSTRMVMQANISLIEYEAKAFATWFNGTIATLSDAECAELGLSGHLYPSKGAEFNWGKSATEGNIIFETDTANITEEDVWTANEMYRNTAIGRQGLENSAILGMDIVLDNYYIANSENGYRTNLSNVYWGTDSQSELEKMIVDYNVYGKYSRVLPEGYLTSPTESMWPMVSNVYILDENSEKVNVIGGNTVQFVVEFNRDMNVTVPLNVTFGSSAPYADYIIEGEWKTSRQWVGKYTLRANIENGIQHLVVSGAQAAEDAFFTAEDKTGRFTFVIDTTAAMAMSLQANVLDNGIQLTFAQDDYDTLLGYNIYRSEEKDGNYVKLNPAILLPTDSTFLDENAEPGKTYWYTYTVVLTDFTESNPAGKVVATAKDTMAPNMYHTPVNQGYLNNNLVISCTASDNVAITSVVLYYRAVGVTEWKTITMLKQNDKYSATIFGSELTLEGLEYYIVANDTFNSISKGSAETPYTVVIKDASAISRKGDVDGDGVVTTKDALMIMQCINGDLIMSDDEFKRADLNSDGVLSSMEALRILQYINGNVTTLEM